MFRWLKLLLAAFSIMLVSCSYNNEDTSCEYNDLLPKLRANQDFLATGVMVVAENKQKHKLNFVWKQKQRHYKIDITGPLGLHIAEIENGVLKIVNEEVSHNLRDFMLEHLHYYISPLALKNALLLHDSANMGVKVLEVSYGCSNVYNLPKTITVHPQNTDIILYIKRINWQL